MAEKENQKINPEDLKKQGEESKISSSPVDKSRELEGCQKQKEEYLQGWQRARADFLNYKKEEMERIGELLKYAGEEYILRILPILDNFEMVEKKMPEDLKNNENVKGLLLIKTQLQDFLKNQGVEEIKTIGEKFDPNLHEVVGEVEMGEEDKSSSSTFPSGQVTEEIQKGYKINGRLLRPAKVKIIK